MEHCRAGRFLYKIPESNQHPVDRKVFFQKYEDTHFYKFNVTKHNSIIYTYGEDVLYLHRILQNFQDPDDNYDSLKDL